MTKILLVTNEGCSHCTRVKQILKAMKNEIPSISVKEVNFSSKLGLEISTEHQIFYPPAVFIDGKLFGSGNKISEDELKKSIRSIVKHATG